MLPTVLVLACLSLLVSLDGDVGPVE